MNEGNTWMNITKYYLDSRRRFFRIIQLYLASLRKKVIDTFRGFSRSFFILKGKDTGRNFIGILIPKSGDLFKPENFFYRWLVMLEGHSG